MALGTDQGRMFSRTNDLTTYTVFQGSKVRPMRIKDRIGRTVLLKGHHLVNAAPIQSQYFRGTQSTTITITGNTHASALGHGLAGTALILLRVVFSRHHSFADEETDDTERFPHSTEETHTQLRFQS